MNPPFGRLRNPQITTWDVDFGQFSAIFSINLIEPVLPSLPTVMPAAIFMVVTVAPSVGLKLIGLNATRHRFRRTACARPTPAERRHRTLCETTFGGQDEGDLGSARGAASIGAHEANCRVVIREFARTCVARGDGERARAPAASPPAPPTSVNTIAPEPAGTVVLSPPQPVAAAPDCAGSRSGHSRQRQRPRSLLRSQRSPQARQIWSSGFAIWKRRCNSFKSISRTAMQTGALQVPPPPAPAADGTAASGPATVMEAPAFNPIGSEGGPEAARRTGAVQRLLYSVARQSLFATDHRPGASRLSRISEHERPDRHRHVSLETSAIWSGGHSRQILGIPLPARLRQRNDDRPRRVPQCPLLGLLRVRGRPLQAAHQLRTVDSRPLRSHPRALADGPTGPGARSRRHDSWRTRSSTIGSTMRSRSRTGKLTATART